MNKSLVNLWMCHKFKMSSNTLDLEVETFLRNQNYVCGNGDGLINIIKILPITIEMEITRVEITLD